MMALREAELQGIHTFCLTVDPAGHDYLREMCPERQYLVIDDVAVAAARAAQGLPRSHDLARAPGRSAEPRGKPARSLLPQQATPRRR